MLLCCLVNLLFIYLFSLWQKRHLRQDLERSRNCQWICSVKHILKKSSVWGDIQSTSAHCMAERSMAFDQKDVHFQSAKRSGNFAGVTNRDWDPLLSIKFSSDTLLLPASKCSVMLACLKTPSKLWKLCTATPCHRNCKYGMAWNATNTFKSLKGANCFFWRTCLPPEMI